MESLKSFYTRENDDKLYSLLQNIYKEYIFLDISWEDFLQLEVKLNLAKIETYKKEPKLLLRYLRAVILNAVVRKVRKLSDEKRLQILVNFINYRAQKYKGYSLIKKVITLSNRFAYDFNQTFLQQVINSCPAFKEALDNFIQNQMNSQQTSIKRDPYMCLIIESYCEIYKIKIPKFLKTDEMINIAEFDNSQTSSDALKLYIKEISNHPLLRANEELELFKKAQQGDIEAKTKIVNSNLRFVVSIAKRYTPTTSLSFLDIIQEGNLGLMRAVKTFDVELGTKFSTYSADWINQYIKRALTEKSDTIRIPNQTKDKFLKYIKKKAELLKTNEAVTSEELALALGTTPKKVEEFRRIEFLSPVSLNETFNTDRETEFFVRDDFDLEADYESQECSNILSDILQNSNLTPRETEILKLVSGYYGPKKKLTEVAKIFNISPERARQIYNKALEKLKTSENEHKLFEYSLSKNNILDTYNPAHPSLFDYFDSPQESILFTLNFLSTSQISLLNMLFGYNYDKARVCRLTPSQIEEFENVILPLISTHLAKDENLDSPPSKDFLKIVKIINSNYFQSSLEVISEDKLPDVFRQIRILAKEHWVTPYEIAKIEEIIYEKYQSLHMSSTFGH